MNFQAGTGVLIMTPNVGLLAANPSPYRFPVLQDVAVEFKGDLKKLYGQKQFALDVFRGKVDVTGKGKMIVPSPDLLGQLYLGASASTGINRFVSGEAHASGASVAPTNATANADYGVIAIATNGNATQMTKIISGTPTVGQYKFTPYSSTGPTPASYAFAAGETAATVKLNYTWPDTTGETLAIANQDMGAMPQMQMVLFNTYKGKMFALQLNAVVLGSFSIPTKQEDHWICDFDFAASCDGNDNLGSIEADL